MIENQMEKIEQAKTGYGCGLLSEIEAYEIINGVKLSIEQAVVLQRTWDMIQLEVSLNASKIYINKTKWYLHPIKYYKEKKNIKIVKEMYDDGSIVKVGEESDNEI